MNAPCSGRYAGLALLLTPLLAQGQPDTVKFDNRAVYGGKDRPGVTFNHGAHMAVADCLDCHHRMAKGKNVLDASDLVDGAKGLKCADCHAKVGARPTPDQDQITHPLQQAFHKQCLGCHQKFVSQGKKSGPRTCVGCHS